MVRESPPQPVPPPKNSAPPMREETVPVRAQTPVREDARPYPAEKARGGEIILRTPTRRAIFIGGLAGLVLLLILLQFLA